MSTSPLRPHWAYAALFFLAALAVGWWGFRRPHEFDPPFIAARNADAAAIGYHLGRGLEPDARDPQGRALLELVTARLVDERRAGDVEYTTCRMLIEAGADPNILSNGTRPLIQSATLVKARLVRLLLEEGADPNLPDARGRTPLMSLGTKNGVAPVHLALNLLERGADPSIVAEDGYSALKHARTNGMDSVVAILEKRGITR
jgi:ankyrin repeat protein